MVLGPELFCEKKEEEMHGYVCSLSLYIYRRVHAVWLPPASVIIGNDGVYIRYKGRF